VNESPFPNGGIQGACNFSKWVRGVKQTSSKHCKFSSVKKCYLSLYISSFKLKEFFKLLRVFTLKFEKVCEREFFKLLKVPTLKFEKVCERKFFKLKFDMCTREVFKLLKASSFKRVKENSLPSLQVSNEISNLCQKKFKCLWVFL
jgi:hypothetical protein